MTIESQAATPVDTGWLAEAGPLIADLGFSIVTGTHPGVPAATDLLVAMREAPTLAHFDPEEITCWDVVDGRGRQRRIDRNTRFPLEGAFSWGRISIVDRLGMTNQWLSFGGTLKAAELDPATTVVLFDSPGPIQRWSGHSQGLDPLTPEMGAFFGRLRIPIDFEPGAESRIAAAPAVVLYAAFLRDVQARLKRSEQVRLAHPDVATFVGREASRLRTAEPGHWAAAESLFTDLGMAPGR
jgi:hypothetical protein